jgi:hypothetical protein
MLKLDSVFDENGMCKAAASYRSIHKAGPSAMEIVVQGVGEDGIRSLVIVCLNISTTNF